VIRRYAALFLAILIFSAVHEAGHGLLAAAFDEYEAFHIRPFGLEVEYKTPVAQRVGIKWGFISGASNMATLALGYLLFAIGKTLSQLDKPFLQVAANTMTILFMVIDPLNLSVGPLLYGGDIGGVVVGFRVNQYVIQAIFFLVFLINRELIAQCLLPQYGVRARNPLWKPWVTPRALANFRS